MEKIKEKDFIEIDFVGKTKEGEIFDSTKKEHSKKFGKEELKPLKIPLGFGLMLKTFEEEIIGKEIGKEYFIEIKAEKAFGKRNPLLVKMVSIKNFLSQGITPTKGMQFSFDGNLGKIVSVSGGRVLVDFNNPLAGKDVFYEFKILRKIEEKKEQLDSLQEYFFNKIFESEIKGGKAIIKVENNFFPLFEALKRRFEEIVGLPLEIIKSST
ncbi:MAG: peptidylprolyl isomerase [Candidatus Pacearchaeota archaeon]